MRRELRPLQPGAAMRLYSAARSLERPILLSVARRVQLGGYAWHYMQHRLGKRSSLEPDWLSRSDFYRTTLSAGSDLCVFPGCVFHYPENLSIGKHVFINQGVIITAAAPISIGDDVLIGPYCVINSGNHRFSVRSELIRNQGHELSPIKIGNDCWLGAGAVVLPGVTMGSGSVAAAGAVVTKDVGDGMLVAGIPARPVRRRSD